MKLANQEIEVIANCLEVALPIAYRIKDHQIKSINRHYIGTPIAYKYLTFLVGNEYCRVLCIEEGGDGSCYIWHLPKKSGRKLVFHSDPKRGYEVHMYGAGYSKIPESIRFAKKFITNFTDSYFCCYYFDKKQVGGELIEAPTDDDIVFDLDTPDFSGLMLSLFSDYRFDLCKNNCENGTGKLIELGTYNLVAGTLYQNYKRQTVATPRSCR